MGKVLEPLHAAILVPLYLHALYAYIRYRLMWEQKDWPNPLVRDKNWTDNTYFLLFWYWHTLWACVHIYAVAPYLLKKMHDFRDQAKPSSWPFQLFALSAWGYLLLTTGPCVDASNGRRVMYSSWTWLDNTLHAFGFIGLVVYTVYRVLKADRVFTANPRNAKIIRAEWTRVIGWVTFMWIIGGRAMLVLSLGQSFLFDYPTENKVLVVLLASIDLLSYYYYVIRRPAQELKKLEEEMKTK